MRDDNEAPALGLRDTCRKAAMTAADNSNDIGDGGYGRMCDAAADAVVRVVLEAVRERMKSVIADGGGMSAVVSFVDSDTNHWLSSLARTDD